jgi:hypothetical protein
MIELTKVQRYFYRLYLLIPERKLLLREKPKQFTLPELERQLDGVSHSGHTRRFLTDVISLKILKPVGTREVIGKDRVIREVQVYQIDEEQLEDYLDKSEWISLSSEICDRLYPPTLP